MLNSLNMIRSKLTEHSTSLQPAWRLDRLAVGLVLMFSSALCVIPRLAHSAPATVWSQTYQSLGEPLPAYGHNEKNLAIRSDGTPFFGMTIALRLWPFLTRPLYFVGGDSGAVEALPRRDNSRVSAVASLGLRTFSTITTATSGCSVLEVTNTSIAWQTNIAAGTGPCMDLVVSQQGAFAISRANRAIKLSLDGQVLWNVSLGQNPLNAALAAPTASGGMLVATNVSDGSSRFGTLSYVNEIGAIEWQRTIENYTYLHELSVAADGSYLFAYSGSDGDRNLRILRGSLSGNASPLVIVPTTPFETDVTCVVGSELRALQVGETQTILFRVAANGDISSSTIPLTYPEITTFQFDCVGERMFVASVPKTYSLDIREIGSTGTLWVRSVADRWYETFFSMRVSEQGIYVSVSDEWARSYVPQFVAHYDLSGNLLGRQDMPILLVEASPVNISASRNGDPIVVSDTGAGLLLQPVSRDQGLVMSETMVRVPTVELMYNSYRVKRTTDGSIEALISGSGPGTRFNRWQADGTFVSSLAHIACGGAANSDWHYRTNGDLILKCFSGLLSVRNGTVIAAGQGGAAITLTPDDRLFRVTNIRFGESQVEELNESLQPIPASTRALNVSGNGWVMHPDGTIDLATDLNFSRYLTSGSQVFSYSHPDSSVGLNFGRVISSPQHGIVSVLKNDATPAGYTLLHVRADGALAWAMPLPYEPGSVAMDDDGLVGVAGKSGFASFAWIIDAAGQFRMNANCVSEPQCAEAISAIGAAGTRWFVAGTLPPQQDLPRATFVREIDIGLFGSGFE